MREPLRKHLTTVIVAAVVAMVASGGTAMAIVANAHKVDGYHANQLARVSASSKANNAIIGDGTDQIARKVKITAPKKGYLVIVATTDAYGQYTAGGTSSPFCWIELDGTELDSTNRQIQFDGTNGQNEMDCATSVAWPVAPGVHTVEFWGNPNTDDFFDNTNLFAMFVPFNGTGKVPAPIAPTLPTGGVGSNG